MKFDLRSIPPQGTELKGEEPAEGMDLVPEPGEGAGADIRVRSPIRYDLKVSLVSGELIVYGTLSVDTAQRCSRCAEMFEGTSADIPFECVKEAPETANGDESADLTDEMRESIILAFPAYPLCRHDCRGLCPRCGVNWNAESCACKPADDRRWNMLEGLTV